QISLYAFGAFISAETYSTAESANQLTCWASCVPAESWENGGKPLQTKVWPRVTGSTNQYLEVIWQHELRQLQRLAGNPRASGRPVPMHQGPNPMHHRPDM